MTKKPKPIAPLQEFAPAAPPPTAPSSLQKIRAEATSRAADHRRSSAEVIAELESWRNEIDATIAFLRAQNR
jgi:hypothetical protein